LANKFPVGIGEHHYWLSVVATDSLLLLLREHGFCLLLLHVVKEVGEHLRLWLLGRVK